MLTRSHVRAVVPWARLAFSDLASKLRHGPAGPVAQERIWIDPRRIRYALVDPLELGMAPDHPEYAVLAAQEQRVRRLVGRVIGDEVDDLRLFALEDLRKIRACLAHWERGLPWEETEAIEHLMFKIAIRGRAVSGCLTREDAHARYARMDAMYDAVRADGALESRERRRALFRREWEGIQVHLGRGGEPIFGEAGTHRLAIALALGLEKVPASVGFVHESALEELQWLRRCPSEHGSAGSTGQGASAAS